MDWVVDVVPVDAGPALVGGVEQAFSHTVVLVQGETVGNMYININGSKKRKWLDTEAEMA